MSEEQREAFNFILDMIDEWQLKGRTGFCLPVISGDLLCKLERLADERRRDRCSWCGSTGKINDGYEDIDCPHCEQLAEDENR